MRKLNFTPHNDYLRILLTQGIAAEAHHGQFDKAGEAYIWHPLRVGFSLLPDVDACIVGLLHDVFEDAPENANLQWRIDKDLMKDVITLTRIAGEPYEEYILRVKTRPRAAIVKLADLADNLDMTRYNLALARGADPEKMLALHTRYLKARSVLQGWSEQVNHNPD